MTEPDLVEQLAQHRTIGSAPRRELEWLAAHGTLRHLVPGDVVSTRNVPVDNLYVVLEGHIVIFVDRGAGPTKVMEWRGGDVTGMLPYSRLDKAPGDSIVQVPSTVLAIPREHMGELIRECHQITSIMVHSMLDRARQFNASDLMIEKMVSLGKLSAGLAHELNNPASAIERNAALLQKGLEESEQAASVLGATPLTGTQLEAIDGVRNSCHVKRVHGVRSPIEQAEREEDIADWLAAHGVDTAIAGTIAETSVTHEVLDGLAGVLEGPALSAALRWIAAGCSVRNLASEIQEAATRIAGLVIAIKGFTHMDQAAVAEPVDLEKGLGNTVAVLRSKARAKAASVAIEVEPGLPRVLGYVGELNQVWANLIDNALDAIPASGRVDLIAKRERKHVIVRVVDNGSGIPEPIRARIFEPFFTTKPMGQGTGLGLDIVRRLVRHNDGDITVESKPGRTEFIVTLPVAEPAGDGART